MDDILRINTIPLTAHVYVSAGMAGRQVRNGSTVRQDFHSQYGTGLLVGSIVFCTAVWSYVSRVPYQPIHGETAPCNTLVGLAGKHRPSSLCHVICLAKDSFVLDCSFRERNKSAPHLYPSA